VLRLLAHESRAIGELGAAMGITRQAARQLADGLVNRGYATFGTDPADARRTLVVLTPSGEAYTLAIWQAQGALNEAISERVSAADLAAANRVLQAVLTDDEDRQRARQQ
jgi:DNA-binding MarR family transcriptional regulator